MSTALVSTFFDFGEVLSKSNSYKPHVKVGERKSVPNFGTFSTLRRTSTPGNLLTSTSTTTIKPTSLLSSSLVNSDLIAANNNNNNNINNSLIIGSGQHHNHSNQHHRKLDRSLSEPVDRRSSPTNGGNSLTGAAATSGNSSRYKTELCRPFEESGKCKYGDKCQFAHGAHELRTLSRHPKYKTELCRTFHTIGFCPYGPRCHFIHNADGLQPPPTPPPTSQSSCSSPASAGNNGGQGLPEFFVAPGGGFRPKLHSLSDVSLSSSSSTSSSASSLSESPPSSMTTSFFDDIFGPSATQSASIVAPVTPLTPTTPGPCSAGVAAAANNAFTFVSDFTAPLVVPTAVTESQLMNVQQTYNNNPTLLMNNNNSNKNNNLFNNDNNNAINNLETAAFATPVTTPALLPSTPQATSPPPSFNLPPPPPHSPVSSVASDLDNLSLCGSEDLAVAPPSTAVANDSVSAMSASGIRLPIFSRLSTSEEE